SFIPKGTFSVPSLQKDKFNGEVYMNTQAISIISSFTLLLAMICVVAYADYKCIYSKLDRK
ncbi:MAG: hypothetical protein MSA89_01530, partial [Clostridium sp.]|nr:hypothetical protein [Clostridium sp.]